MDEREQRRVYKINDLSIRSWMIVLVSFRNVFQAFYLCSQRKFEVTGYSNI
ncbi:hypothetical protein PVAG01_02228 [Phlyctema vagabunda]|uniref:Uncharacterized protein n=1 Tax=Phlyctema vagabunda TaxID=108571 RepID=A0ABR4PQN3_9HELO